MSSWESPRTPELANILLLAVFTGAASRRAGLEAQPLHRLDLLCILFTCRAWSQGSCAGAAAKVAHTPR